MCNVEPAITRVGNGSTWANRADRGHRDPHRLDPHREIDLTDDDARQPPSRTPKRGFWTRVRRVLGRRRGAVTLDSPAVTSSAPVAGENILLISDLHLGEACKDHSRLEYLKRANTFDEHVCQFLDHYRDHRIDDRPWRLIMGGDLLDFLQVTMTPDGVDEETETYGLGTREQDSAWKLGRLMERHRQVFIYLADFIAAGHCVELIQGNHDEELFWPAVRAALVDGLTAICFGEERRPDLDRETFRGRIHFNSWFFHQPGLIYVEHGHRFDDFCATPPQLCPLRPQDEEELSLPLSALAIRYFANTVPGFKTHDKEHWRFPDYLRYFRGLGLRQSVSILAGYLRLNVRVIAYHLEHGRYRSEAAHEAHQRRARELAELHGLTPAQIEALDALGASSVMGHPLGIYAMMGLGELSAVTGAGVSLLACLFASAPWPLALGLPVVVLAGGLSVARWARGQFPTDIMSKLDRASADIQKIVNVPVVAFGHSHRAVLARMPHDHRAFYVNTGNFLHPERTLHDASAPCNCPHTFAVVKTPRRYERIRPQLNRWCGVLQSPVPYTPSNTTSRSKEKPSRRFADTAQKDVVQPTPTNRV